MRNQREGTPAMPEHRPIAMPEHRPIAALLYDFDKTLCTTDMQNYAFIPGLGLTPAQFWEQVNAFSRANHMEGVLAYMYRMVRESQSRNVPFTRQDLVNMGRDIVLFPGLPDWFGRVNRYGEELGVTVEHYVISSGLREIIEGSGIVPCFREVFASEFYYDPSGRPVWPKLAVNFTAKTQFVYRVNKGVLDVSEERALNDSMPDEGKRVPFANMVYLGDGLSDVPCMKMMRAYGGTAVAVWQEAGPGGAGNRPGVEELLSRGRADFIFPADYRQDTGLDRTVRDILASIAVRDRLRREHAQQRRDVEGKGE